MSTTASSSPRTSTDDPGTQTNALKSNSEVHFLGCIPCPLTHAFLFPWLIYSVILVPAARQSLNHLTLQLILCPPTTGHHYTQLILRADKGSWKALESVFFFFFSFFFLHV